MKSPKPKRPPMRIRRLVMACSRGQYLQKTLRSRPGLLEAEPLWTVEPVGRIVVPDTARDAIALGLIIPRNDGLLGADTSQTFVAAPGAEEACTP